MKKVTVLAMVIFLCLLGITWNAEARFGGKGKGHEKGTTGMPPGKWWKMPQMAEKLNLTKEEKEKLDAMYLEHRNQVIDLRSQVEKERLELDQILESSTFSATACMDRYKKLQKAHSNLLTERFKFLVQVREMLGLERFLQLKEEFQRFRMKRKHGSRHPAKRDIPVG